MRKNIIIFLLSIFTFTLLVFGVQQHRQIRKLRQEKATKEASAKSKADHPMVDINEVAQKNQEQERKAYEETILKLESQIEANEIDSKVSDGKELSKPPKNKSPMAGIAKMMKNPGMKDMIRAQQKASMDISHASLFKYLELSEEDTETFKDLLLEKQMSLIDLSLGMMDGSVSPEERQESIIRIQELTSEFNDKIKTFLGEEDYKVYGEFEKTQPERMQVNLFNQSLGADNKLSEEQEHEMIVSMHEERTNFRFSNNFDQQENFDMSNFNEKSVNRHLDELTQIQDKYIARAEEILTDSQMKQFRNSLDQQRAMQEMGMKMTIQIFGKQGESGPAEESSSD
ncbi:hypothetical protein ACFLS1_05590 [Verrucomicrobiota bacterium]